MDWEAAHKTTVAFLKGILGTGYVDWYYEDFANELIANLKMCEED